MFFVDRYTKVSMVIFDLLLRVKGQKRSKFETNSNNKNNSVNVLGMDKDESVHGDLVRPCVKGSKVKMIKMLKVFC